MPNENKQTEDIAEPSNTLPDNYDNYDTRSYVTIGTTGGRDSLFSIGTTHYVEKEDEEHEEIEEEGESNTTGPIEIAETVERKTLTSSIVREFLSAVDDDQIYLSDSSELSSDSHIDHLAFEPPTRLMIDIDDIPRLSEITVEERRSSKLFLKSEKVIDIDLAGTFVNPLTGETEPSLVEIEVEEEVESEESEKDEEEESLFHISEDDELLILLDKDKEEEEIDALIYKETLLEQKDVMELFLEATATKVQIAEPVIDYEALERERNLVLMQRSINDYLQGLIARIVEACEFIDIKAIMRQNLDKLKLLQEVKSQHSTMKFEQKIHSFLNRKVVEFFKKKKSARVFTPDDPETLTSEIARCQLLTERVDALLGEESTHKKHVADQIESLTICTDELRKSFDGEVFNFEQLVKSAFIREKTSEKFKLVRNMYRIVL